MTMLRSLVLSLLVSTVLGAALPKPIPTENFSYNASSTETLQSDLPTIQLPYGTYRATSYEKDRDVILPVGYKII
jgi:hypothetical protein